MPKQYVLKYLIDDAKAQAVVKRSIRGFQDIEKAALAAAKASEGAVARTAQADAKATAKAVANAQRRAKAGEEAAQKIDVGYYKAVVNGIKYQDKLAAAADKSARDRERIEQQFLVRDYKARVKAEKDKERIADFARSRDAKAIRDREGLEQQYVVKDYQRRVQSEKRRASLEEGAYGRLAKFKRRALSDEEVAAVAANKAIDASNKKRIDGAMKALGEEKDAFALGIAQAFGLSGAATKAGTALLGIGAAVGGIKLVAGALGEARRNAQGLGKDALGFLGSIRAVASVAGRRPDQQFASEVQAFGARTGLGGEGAAQFLESFLGRAQIVKGRNLGDKEFGDYSEAAAKIAVAKGLPNEVAGDLFGGVLKTENFRAKGQGAKEAAARAVTAIKILDAGSGKLPILGPQLNELMATLASESELEGVFRNAGEAAVATSVAAEANPQEAATMVQRTAEALRDFEDKDKAAFFKRAGITDRDTFPEAIQKANKVIGEEVAKGVPVDTAIKSFGFDKERIGKRGLKTFYNARETVLKPQLANLAAGEGPGGVAAAQAMIGAYDQEEVVRGMRGEAKVGQAKFEKGRPETELEIAKREAEAKLIGKGLDTGVGYTLLKGLMSAVTFGSRGGRDAIIEAEALRETRRRAGMDPTVQTGELMFGDNGAEIRKLLKIIAENTKKAPAGQPAPARPAPPMLGQPVGAQPGR